MPLTTVKDQEATTISDGTPGITLPIRAAPKPAPKPRKHMLEYL